jgi:hypothetical protein
MEHEAAFVKGFIASAKQARWAQYLSNAKRRKEILNQLNHNLPYVPELGTEVPDRQDYPAELERLLKAKGAGPTCHVMVDGLKIDGRELPLAEALNHICMHESGAVLSCIPGRLAYYKPESPNRGVILERISR